jgi:hypothetical protein
MSLPSYEKLGVFYLGREFDPGSGKLGADLLYDSRDLTTHAVCIGMTGSGKTGLCLSLLEEAALDGVPAIAIDPKGDIANLALTFPGLRAEDFRPWIDEREAARKQQTPDEYAATTAEQWRKGLAEWGQDDERVGRLHAAAEVTIYTPGSDAGRPLSVLRSFSAPDAATLSDATALKERIGSAVSGLLALLGIEADPIRSREHILLSALLDSAWRAGASPDLAALIQGVQRPPFDKIGVFDLESFYPAKERTELALRVNGLLAAPGFEAWLSGEPLDVQKLLYTQDGKPRVSIISIAHLNDAERMFVVTLVANELVAWMRRQPGTSSLRALFYMDEIFGYFPPSAMPPSKLPMLTLLKQARAFGVGVVLATQNPVDLDYKGLGNAGTWFIGRLQTERDRARVVDGLLGSEGGGGLDRKGLEQLLTNLGQRTFLVRNVHEDAPVLMRTRWAMAYLRGPLTLAEIGRLTPRAATPVPSTAPAAAVGSTAPGGSRKSGASSSGGSRPVVEHGVTERFLETRAPGAPHYRPFIGARVRAHYVDAKAGLDAWQTTYWLAAIGADGPDWDSAEAHADPGPRFAVGPAAGATYDDVPGAALSPREYKRWAAALEDSVARSGSMSLWTCPPLKLTATPGASEGEFRAQVALALREKRDAAVEALRSKYASKIATLEDRTRRAEQRVEREKTQASSQTLSTALAVGGGLLGAIFGGGRRRSTLRQAETAARNMGRAGKERADVEHAEADVHALRRQIEALESQLAGEVAALEVQYDPGAVRIEEKPVKPRRSDLAVDDVALVWAP